MRKVENQQISNKRELPKISLKLKRLRKGNLMKRRKRNWRRLEK